jgi:hypothetical protein
VKHQPQGMYIEKNDPVFYSTIQHPSDYEMHLLNSQVPIQKKLSRGSSYAERRNKKKLNYSHYEDNIHQENLRLRNYEMQRNQPEYRNENYIVESSVLKNNQANDYEQIVENQDEKMYKDPSPEQITSGEVEELNVGQNVFYDNASKSNSPTKKNVPKLLTQTSNQLSFSNMTSDNNNNLSKKKIKNKERMNANISNKPKSMMRLASEEDHNFGKGSSRIGKNLTKGKLKQTMVNPDTGKPLRKRNSKVAKKKGGGDGYRQVPTKRRAKKLNYPQEDSLVSKSYKNNVKSPKYMMNAKKKMITMGDRKMYGKGSPSKNDDDKVFNNYTSKLPRTCKCISKSN